MSSEPDWRVPKRDDFDTSDAEIEFLLKTLQEYVESLRKKIDQSRSIELQFTAIVGGFTTGFVALFPFLTEMSRLGEGPFIGNVYKSLILITTTTTVLYIVYLLISFRSRSRSDARRYSKIVLSLIRRASQIRDRGHLPFAQHIILDIRLADAEAELDRIELIKEHSRDKSAYNKKPL